MTRHDESARMSKDAVLAEHRALREILARMRAASTRDDLVGRLREFRAAAGGHFDGEEAQGGFYDNVLLAAPRHQAVLDDLRSEHGRFLREADELLQRAQECGEQDLGCVREAVAALADRLGDHEAAENEILLEVMNTDLGAGD